MTAQAASYRLGYRSDIEGLRAVAILLVVAAHARIAGFAGGFVGVDMFFVLSGYLITGLLEQEIETSGGVRFAAFYARRFRRLLPGLLLMLAVTAFAANWLVAPADLPEQGSAAAAAALWASNFFFAFDRVGYFSAGADSNLFLHTWSLGVEEQFYLVWPLLLVLATTAGSGARTTLRRVRLLMPAIMLAGLIACAALDAWDPNLAFYMMPSRAWQFALGGFVYAQFGTTRNEGRATAMSSGWLTAFGWIGLLTTLLSATWLGPQRSYPWPWALLPSLGTAAMLASGACAPQRGVGALLSLRPLQSIGRVSYSWYLWHWPVLLLGAVVIDTQSVAPRIALAALSLLIAALAFRFVEAPLRRYSPAIRFPRTAVATALSLVAIAGFSGALWRDGSESRLQQPQHKRYTNLIYDSPVIYGLGCDDWYNSATVNPCSFGPATAPHTAVIMGDSVGLQWFPAVAKLFAAPDWRLVALTKSACPMVDAPVFYARLRRVYTECAQWRSEALRHVASLKPDVVVIGSTYSYELSSADWIEGSKRVLQAISPATGHVYVLRATPRLPFNPRSCLSARSLLKEAEDDGSTCSATVAAPEADAVFGWIKEAVGQFPNVSTIDLNELVCPHAHCSAERDGIIVFRDNEHLTTGFVESMTGALGRALQAATPAAVPMAQHAASPPAMTQSSP